MVIDSFKSKIVFLDTAPLIYFIEGNKEYKTVLKKLFQANANGEFLFITSTITLIEVLVHPLKLLRFDLVEQYQTILTQSATLDIIDVSKSIAFKAAELRGKHNLKTPDSIQLATALECEANYFITNDKGLPTTKNI
jgi:predicted nucleic acid-binding protein